jgi:uncharacterized protein YjbK
VNQEIEIEFKNIVTEAEFSLLCEKFSIEKAAFQKQINHYFDTDDFRLKKHGSALRIREKNNTFTLTLKQPNEVGLLETHQNLTKDEAEGALNFGKLPLGSIASQLENSFQIDLSKCLYLGSLKTNRAEIPYLGGTLVFDHSFYFDVDDFEIEYEVKDEKKGKEVFENIFSKYKIPLRKTDNKIKRFFLMKQKKQ